MWRELGPRALLASFRSIDAEAAAERATHPGYDRRPTIALLVCILTLVLMEYAGDPRTLDRMLRAHDATHPFLFGPSGFYATRWVPALDLVYWIAFRILGFFILPALAVRFWLRERIRDQGLSVRNLRAHLPAYAAIYLAVLPLIILAATRPEFCSYYPFYKRAHESWADLIVWELLYAAHFVALEFFFRGFLLQTMRRALGSHAIFVMVVPYCMIHFTKPLLEVLGAIPAGIVLGTLALRTNSIWGGVLVHVAVAFTMDALALLQGKGFPTTVFP